MPEAAQWMNAIELMDCEPQLMSGDYANRRSLRSSTAVRRC